MAAFARYKPIIDEWDAFQEAVLRPLPGIIWANPGKIDPNQLSHLLPSGALAQPLPWHPGAFRLSDGFSPGSHWAYLAGLYHIQEEVSLLPVHLLDPQPGERILDLCAAPGNKTAQISLAMRNTGTVVANDRNTGRMRAARQALDRLGIFNASTTIYDGGNFTRQAGPFDKILVDAPCTCEGTCRKDASVLHNSLNHSEKMVGTQKALLRKAVQLCRPGGRIVYATCTFAPEENELVVEAILREYGPEIVRLLPAHVPNFTASPGLTHWAGQKLADSMHCAMRVWPHQNNTGGFFVALLEKQPGASGPADLLPEKSVGQHTVWVRQVEETFGLDSAVFANYHFVKGGRARLYLVNPDHQPPLHPQPDATGMFFMHVEGKYPKMTTGAAQTFAKLATRRVVELSPGQASAYLARQDASLAAEQVADCQGTGYVLVRYQGIPLGVGVYRARQGVLESLFPKGWAREGVNMNNEW